VAKIMKIQFKSVKFIKKTVKSKEVEALIATTGLYNVCICKITRFCIFHALHVGLMTFKEHRTARFLCNCWFPFLNPEGGSQNATLVVVGISSLKIPKAFLIRSGAQRNFAYTFVLTLPTDLPSQIFHLFSN